MNRASAAAGLVVALAAAGCAWPPPASMRDAARSGPTDASHRAAIRLQLATQYLKAGQAATALDEVKAAMAIDPDAPDARHMLALAYMELGQPEPADANFRRALAAAPKDGDLLNNYGWFLCAQGGRPGPGMAMLRQAAQTLPAAGASRPWINLGACQMRQGDLDGAQQSLTRAIHLDAGNLPASLALARLHYQRREYARAMPCIERVNGRGNPTAESLWLGVRIARRLGNVSQQRAWSAQLQSRFPGAPEEAAFERGAWDD